MYERLKATFTKLNIDFEIIFVNDCSPDDTEEVIRAISRNDRRVIGISHSRNFGSQSAFRSGMEIATKNACVLLDGDLQDPPELIEQFVALWREGYDVVYGRRVKREATLFMQFAYKAFYRVFDYFSYIPIPHDAGDFSLMDKRVVQAILQFPERDLFLRGVRAFAGLQADRRRLRPARADVRRSTNNLLKNIGWAKKGILSFSNTPLNMMSFAGVSLLGLSVVLGLIQVGGKLLFPDLVPPGVTTTLLLVLFFGSLNFFGISVLGEYLAKIFEEVKRRPHFIRRSVIRDGEVRTVGDLSQSAGDHGSGGDRSRPKPARRIDRMKLFHEAPSFPRLWTLVQRRSRSARIQERALSFEAHPTGQAARLRLRERPPERRLQRVRIFRSRPRPRRHQCRQETIPWPAEHALSRRRSPRSSLPAAASSTRSSSPERPTTSTTSCSKSLLAELHYCLKPGGKVHLIDPVFQEEDGWSQKLMRRIDRGRHTRTLDEILAIVEPLRLFECWRTQLSSSVRSDAPGL